MTVKPALTGRQLVRDSLPLPQGFLREGQVLVVNDGQRRLPAATEFSLGIHPYQTTQVRTSDPGHVSVRVQRHPAASVLPFSRRSRPKPASEGQVNVNVTGTTSLLPIQRSTFAQDGCTGVDHIGRASIDIVESNDCFRWRRIHTRT